MSEQGVERARLRLGNWASQHSNVTPLDGTDRDSPTFGDLREVLAALATPPVPAGEVGELVERLRARISYEANRNSSFRQNTAALMERSAALLERYAAENEELRQEALVQRVLRERAERPTRPNKKVLRP